MSSAQLGVAGRGAQGGRGRGAGAGRKGAGPRAYRSGVTEIAEHTFNCGNSKFAAKFATSKEAVANYVQMNYEEGFLVAQEIRLGQVQAIDMPAAVDPNDPDAADLAIVRQEEVKAVAKARNKKAASTKKAFALVYEQCSPAVKDKLKDSDGWQACFDAQELHTLIEKVQSISVGMDDHSIAT